MNPSDDDTRPAPKPVRKPLPHGGPSKAEKAELRAALLLQRAELAQSSSDLATETLKGSGQEFKLDHMAEYGSDNFEQDMSLSLLEEEAELLEEIGVALLKIDDQGDLPYGVCEQCATETKWDAGSSAPWIPMGRLRAVPYARFCLAHQEEQEEV